ncbi:hypothetical protein PDR5_21590 [Pseudomonas sp. DR 5-09]|nr:hypothetical protein PDR5_21590 [Pseudomonas sp. DR 5-09]
MAAPVEADFPKAINYSCPSKQALLQASAAYKFATTCCVRLN